MPASFQEILNSRLFKFVVGETADGVPTEFQIHEEAIAQLSTPLHNNLKGELVEAKAGYTAWKDVSKETFERLVQFAYTGDYTIPKGSVVKRVVKTAGKEKEDPWDDFMPPSSKKSKKGKKGSKYLEEVKEPPAIEEEIKPSDNASFLANREAYPRPPSPMLAADFNTLSYPLSAPRNNHLSTCEPAEKFSPTKSYANVFLAHAALYNLSSYWLIDSLQALSLYKLHKTLCLFQLSGDHTNDVIDLARYVYAEDSGGIGEGNGGVRGMVCQYIAQHAIELAASEEFIELLGEGGQFVKDFFKFELQRIH